MSRLLTILDALFDHFASKHGAFDDPLRNVPLNGDCFSFHF